MEVYQGRFRFQEEQLQQEGKIVLRQSNAKDDRDMSLSSSRVIVFPEGYIVFSAAYQPAAELYIVVAPQNIRSFSPS